MSRVDKSCEAHPSGGELSRSCTLGRKEPDTRRLVVWSADNQQGIACWTPLNYLDVLHARDHVIGSGWQRAHHQRTAALRLVGKAPHNQRELLSARRNRGAPHLPGVRESHGGRGNIGCQRVGARMREPAGR